MNTRMNTRKTILLVALRAMSASGAILGVAALTACTLGAQASAEPPGSDSVALAIVARSVQANMLGPVPEYSHWIDEMQFGDGPVSRTEVFIARPDKLPVRLTIGDQVIMEFGTDGTAGWSFTPGTGVTTVTGPELEEMRAGVLTFETPPAGSDVRLVAAGWMKLDGEFVNHVLMIGADGDTTDAYYSMESGLLSALRLPAANGRRGRTITLYRDYKSFGGEQIATTKIALLSTGTKWTTRMVHMSTDPIPEERFKMPSVSRSP